MSAYRNKIEAYKKNMESGLISKRRAEVYQILSKYGPCTGSEASSKWKAVKGERNSENIRNRITELVKMGAVEIVGNAVDKHTGMKVSVYDLSKNVVVPLLKKPSSKDVIKKLKNQLEKADKRIDNLLEAVNTKHTCADTCKVCYDVFDRALKVDLDLTNS